MAVHLSLPQLNREIRIESPGDNSFNLLNLLIKDRIPLAHSCAGEGVCGTCTLHIEGRDIPLANSLENRLLKRLGSCDASKDSQLRFACLVKTPKVPINWVLRTDYW